MVEQASEREPWKAPVVGHMGLERIAQLGGSGFDGSNQSFT